jgi:hypothetical protein
MPNYLRGINEEDATRVMAQMKQDDFLDAWKHHLRALVQEELSICSTRHIQSAPWILQLWQIMITGFGTLFCMTNLHNDINVLQRSPMFARLVECHAPPCKYEINGHQYTKGYNLADDIYSRWSTFMKTIGNPLGLTRSYFASR